MAEEKAILVSVLLPAVNAIEAEDARKEMYLLATTAGVEVVDELTQKRQKLHPANYLGKGKLEELTRMVKMHQASTLIFDADLTPAQIKNLERVTGAKIIDRSTLILHIFALHARTRAARTQVELAQLKYLLPRLTRQWSHLSRQVGGIGTKGPGETQLETDRRIIRRRIQHLKGELEKIDRQRVTRRKGRKEIFQAALVGYTNVGKSTLMNALSGANVLVENQLFATLDSTIRWVDLSKKHRLLLSDTVGFIRKLPHHLIASFRSTLDEVLDADLLLHVVDVSHPAFAEQIQTVNNVLRNLRSNHKPVLMVFNKIDLLEDKGLLAGLKARFPRSIFISASRHIRIGGLKEILIGFIEQEFREEEIVLPLEKAGLKNIIYSYSTVLEESYTASQIHFLVRCSRIEHEKIQIRLERHGVNGVISAKTEQEVL